MFTHITIRFDELAHDIILAALGLLRDGIERGDLPPELVSFMTAGRHSQLPTLEQIGQVSAAFNMTSPHGEEGREDNEVRMLSLEEGA